MKLVLILLVLLIKCVYNIIGAKSISLQEKIKIEDYEVSLARNVAKRKKRRGAVFYFPICWSFVPIETATSTDKKREFSKNSRVPMGPYFVVATSLSVDIDEYRFDFGGLLGEHGTGDRIGGRNWLSI